MTNRYFQLSDERRKKFQLKLLMLSLLIILSSGALILLISPKLIFLVIFIIAILLTVIAPFFDVPSLVKKGDLTYHSLFLLTEKENNKSITVHGGTLFDYYFVLQKDMTRQERKKVVLLEYLKGLKKLLQNTSEEVKIQGTSYIINERTANKLGLRKVATNSLQHLILFFNYLNLTASISLLNKALVFPKLNNIKTFEGEIGEIKDRESFINGLIEKLEETPANKGKYINGHVFNQSV